MYIQMKHCHISSNEIMRKLCENAWMHNTLLSIDRSTWWTIYFAPLTIYVLNSYLLIIIYSLILVCTLVFCIHTHFIYEWKSIHIYRHQQINEFRRLWPIKCINNICHEIVNLVMIRLAQNNKWLFLSNLVIFFFLHTIFKILIFFLLFKFHHLFECTIKLKYVLLNVTNSAYQTHLSPFFFFRFFFYQIRRCDDDTDIAHKSIFLFWQSNRKWHCDHCEWFVDKYLVRLKKFEFRYLIIIINGDTSNLRNSHENLFSTKFWQSLTYLRYERSSCHCWFLMLVIKIIFTFNINGKTETMQPPD